MLEAGVCYDLEMMTRQHFQFIADVLRNSNAPTDVVLAFADELATTNSRFDREKFLTAAGQG